MSTTTYRRRERGRSAKPNRRQEAAETALSDVLELFRDPKRLPAAVAQTVLVRQAGESPMSAWSLPNQLLCVLAGTDDARGIRQWNEVGRRVTKGARALRILAPRTRKVTDTDDSGNEVERFVTVGFLGVPVFRVEDTEGAPLPPKPDYSPETLPPLAEVAGRLGVEVTYHPASSGRGMYLPSDDSIVLATHDVDTWFHELAHAAHARVLRERGTEIKGRQDAAQEVVAEVVAATLCKLYGYDGYLAEAEAYVSYYSQGTGSAKAALRVLGEVQAALGVIVGEPSDA